MVKVLIIESERGWGQRVDSIQNFDTREKAISFCEEFNRDNNEPVVPDWYMFATLDE